MVDFKQYDFTISLGTHSKEIFLKNVIEIFGYTVKCNVGMEGLSGINYKFEAVGIKDKKILLVVGGKEYREKYLGIKIDTSFDFEEEIATQYKMWKMESVLKLYDVQQLLTQQGWVVELMLFHNTHRSKELSEEGNLGEWENWLAKYKLHYDLDPLIKAPIDPIKTFSVKNLSELANSIGACFLSLSELKISEIALLTKSINVSDQYEVRKILERTRTLQYFYPPSDELILHSINLTESKDKTFPENILKISSEFGHEPSDNILIDNIKDRDPISIVKGLEKHKYISFESEYVITTSEGIKYSEKITKTAQESFIIKLIKAINLPEIVSNIIKILGIKTN